jgi:PAS domain S-box-containing protein
MMGEPMRSSPAAAPSTQELAAENAELRLRLQEFEDTLNAIHSGDVDALVVNNDIYTLESAHAATNRLRQDVLGQMEDAVFAFDNEGHVIYVNASAERQYGVSFSDVLGRLQSEVFVETDRTEITNASRPAQDGRTSVAATHVLPDGRSFHVESVLSPLADAGGQQVGSLAVVRDVTQRRRAELRRDALSTLTDRLRDLDDTIAVVLETSKTLGETLRASRAGYAMVDHGAETLVDEHSWTAPGVQVEDRPLKLRDFGSFVESLKRDEVVRIADVRRDPRTAAAAAALEERSARSFVNVPVIEHRQLVALIYVSHGEVRDWTRDDMEFIREVAERTRAVVERVRNAAALRSSELRLREANEGLEATVMERTRELLQTEEALRQSQKMEAVGQLTGGIAHDFNNLLGGVSASLQVLQARLKQGRLDGIERYIAMGQESVKRAASLTQRLLAFARRQTLDPRPTDLNRLAGGMEDLIRRTVGPDVAVEVVGAGGMWATRIDPSQLENSLLNLCINARDAMLPQGGRLTIETANRWLDGRAAAEHELVPGQYVSLSVTDTGTGMSPEVIKRIFDPFYTTKPLGQGTGLGLSMVYGFVRQSGGQVRVYSEMGVGTTMCLYLPRHVGAAVEDHPLHPAEEMEKGDGETVLVIEDEQTIRLLIAEVLREAGYEVLAAEDGVSGLRLLQTARRVDLLVTDVGLPGGLNGRQVADASRISRPGLKVLFVTGYAENAAVGNGHLDRGMEVLTKPFEIAVLANKVREMMGSTERG